MESDDEFFDANEFVDSSEDEDHSNEKNREPKIQDDESAVEKRSFEHRSDSRHPSASMSSIRSSMVHFKHKKFSEFSNMSIIHEQELPFKSTSWLIEFSPEGSHLALAGNNGTILVYSLSTDSVLSSPLYLSEHAYDITCLSWSSQSTLLSSSIDHTVKEWGLSIQSLNTFQYHCKIVSCLYLPQDNNFFIASFEDFVIRTVYIPNKQIVSSVQLYEDILCMAVAHSGNVVAVGMNKGKVIPFRVRESDFKLIDRPVLHAKNHRGFKKSGKPVTGLYFIDDDQLLITTLDSNIRLFNLQDYQMKQKYKGAQMKSRHFRAVGSDDRNYVLCGSEKGKFLIWNTTIPMKLKNKEYESVKFRKKKLPEFSTFAPRGAIEILRKVEAYAACRYLIASMDVSNSLKILIC